LEGTYTLQAMSMLNRIDTYLETAPESQQGGFHFGVGGLESLTPAFALYFRPEGDTRSERIEIFIDPPMQPGNRLVYRWRAQASPSTFATTLQQLEQMGLRHEYMAWDIIAPMKRLEMVLSIPWEQDNPPVAWFELWRVGRWHAATQAHTAYRAFLKDDPSRAQLHIEACPPDRFRLHLEVNYPWLAMSYVLAWGL
ncbi:MAG: hypothetical protein KKB13_11540, partial [Chloroflexi bacterium]|nr:hypothetical protein [Chloroflexota bacterium]